MLPPAVVRAAGRASRGRGWDGEAKDCDHGPARPEGNCQRGLFSQEAEQGGGGDEHGSGYQSGLVVPAIRDGRSDLESDDARPRGDVEEGDASQNEVPLLDKVDHRYGAPKLEVQEGREDVELRGVGLIAGGQVAVQWGPLHDGTPLRSSGRQSRYLRRFWPVGGGGRRARRPQKSRSK